MKITATRFTSRASLALLAMLIAGCASNGGIVDKTLKAVGIRETPPEGPAVIELRLLAGSNLNAANDGRATAAVIKIYHLRNIQRFQQAPYAAFLDQAGEQASLGADLLSVNEIVMTPGSRQTFTETVKEGSAAIGVVALFRAPAENRWRLAFDTAGKTAASKGVTVGVHACALTTDSEALLSPLSGDPGSLASVQCAGAR